MWRPSGNVDDLSVVGASFVLTRLAQALVRWLRSPDLAGGTMSADRVRRRMARRAKAPAPVARQVLSSIVGLLLARELGQTPLAKAILGSLGALITAFLICLANVKDAAFSPSPHSPDRWGRLRGRRSGDGTSSSDPGVVRSQRSSDSYKHATLLVRTQQSLPTSSRELPSIAVASAALEQDTTPSDGGRQGASHRRTSPGCWLRHARVALVIRRERCSVGGPDA